MKLPFLRTSEHDEPLVVSMTGTRLGDSVLFAGTSRALILPLAARTGLSGRLVLIGDGDAAKRLEATAARDGVLLELASKAPAGAAFDLAVIETVEGWRAAVASVHPSVRSGGRVIVIAGQPRKGLLGALRSGGGPPPPPNEEIVEVLRVAGWQRIRPIGEREGLRFVEAFA